MTRESDLDAIFAALADPTRRAILSMLLEDDMAVTDVAAPFGISLAAISKHLATLAAAGLTALTGPDPHWPEGTRHVSELRLSLRVQPRGLLSGLRGIQNIHLDIVDYPGEWLLDLRLMDRSFAEWSAEVLARMEGRPGAAAYLAEVAAAGGDGTDRAPVVTTDDQVIAVTATVVARPSASMSMSSREPK